MKVTEFKLATLTGLLVCSLSANATIVDNNTYTTDTVTGLDWLDVTQTMNRSYNDVSTDTTLAMAGWHYATKDDLIVLLNDFASFTNSTIDVSNQIWSSTNALNGLISLLGDTEATWFQNTYHTNYLNYIIQQQNFFFQNGTDGLLAPDNSPPYPGYTVIAFIDHISKAFPFPNPDPTGELSVSTWYSPKDSVTDSNYGSFLIRNDTSIPEPTTIALLVSGLIGLGLSRRKASSITSTEPTNQLQNC